MSVRDQIKNDLKTAAARKLPTKGALTLASWLATLSLGFLAFFIFDYFLWHKVFTNSDIHNNSNLGTFGDFIGGIIGTVLAFVTVLLVWLTYQSQKEELRQLRKQGNEQIEIQALSTLIPLYKQTIKEIDELLNNPMTLLGEHHPDYIKDTIVPARQRREYYEFLLTSAENLLLTKSKTLFSYSHMFVTNRDKESNTNPH